MSDKLKRLEADLGYLRSGWFKGVSCRGPEGVPACVPVLHPLVLDASQRLIDRVDKTFGYCGTNKLPLGERWKTVDQEQCKTCVMCFTHWEHPAFTLGELRALVVRSKRMEAVHDRLVEALEATVKMLQYAIEDLASTTTLEDENEYRAILEQDRAALKLAEEN